MININNDYKHYSYFNYSALNIYYRVVFLIRKMLTSIPSSNNFIRKKTYLNKIFTTVL